MDGMRIESKFLTGVISKLLERTVRKKLGCDIDIRLNSIVVTGEDGKFHAHLDLDCTAEKETLAKILGSAGQDKRRAV